MSEETRPRRNAFAALRTRGSATADRTLLMTGGFLIAAGVVLILLGWIGASKTPFVFEQVPYLISGGVLGLALVVGGGFVYFAYWQTRAVRDAREHQHELLGMLREIKDALAENRPDSAAVSRAGNGAPVLVSTEKGTMFHRPDCPAAQGRTGLRTVRGDEPGLRPCGICNPLVTA